MSFLAGTNTKFILQPRHCVKGGLASFELLCCKARSFLLTVVQFVSSQIRIRELREICVLWLNDDELNQTDRKKQNLPRGGIPRNADALDVHVRVPVETGEHIKGHPGFLKAQELSESLHGGAFRTNQRLEKGNAGRRAHEGDIRQKSGGHCGHCGIEHTKRGVGDKSLDLERLRLHDNVVGDTDSALYFELRGGAFPGVGFLN